MEYPYYSLFPGLIALFAGIVLMCAVDYYGWKLITRRMDNPPYRPGAVLAMLALLLMLLGMAVGSVRAAWIHLLLLF